MHKGINTPLYTQFDVRSCVPLPQVTEHPEPILQDDQVGHVGVLQDSLLVRFDVPLSNKTKVCCLAFRVCSKSLHTIALRKRSFYDVSTMNDDESLR